MERGRPRLTVAGVKPLKHVWTPHNYRFKLNVAEHLATHNDPRATLAFFFTGLSDSAREIKRKQIYK